MAKASKKVEATTSAWSSTAPLGEFRPYVPESANVPEFTFKAVLFGAIFGIIFGAVTVYVGLRAGLTVSASIPIAVLSISLLRAFGKATILENNIVQTAGSAGESVAAGAIFTLPALIFMGFPFEYSRIFLLALIGGWIGVLFMIPLRRQLIVQEHGNLLYPEGTACADVLVAGEKGGSFASRVFWGLGLGGVYTFLMATAQVWKQRPLYEPAWLPGASFRAEITSEYLGVGYIIGPRIAGTIFAGGVFSWLVLMPAIKFFGEGLAEPLYPSTIPVRNMTPGQLWESYIRPMGAGAVAMAGLITLMKTMPTIVSALRSGVKDIRSQQTGTEAGGRLERDIPMKWVVLGSIAIVIAMWLMLTFNPIAGARTSGFENVVASLFVVIFGFLFVTVSSRICGLIGTSANPVSGMTIATLMATCAMFLAMGWNAPAYSALAITIGGVVCVAAANAGATSQDLKTGFLIGATPYRQQWALMIGVMVSVFVIGGTLMLMNFGLSEFRPMQRALDIDKVRAEQSQRGAAVRVEKELDDPHPQIYRDKRYFSSTPSARGSCPTASISTIPRPARSKCSGSPASAATRRPRRKAGSWPPSSPAFSTSACHGAWSRWACSWSSPSNCWGFGRSRSRFVRTSGSTRLSRSSAAASCDGRPNAVVSRQAVTPKARSAQARSSPVASSRPAAFWGSSRS